MSEQHLRTRIDAAKVQRQRAARLARNHIILDDERMHYCEHHGWLPQIKFYVYPNGRLYCRKCRFEACKPEKAHE